MSLSATQGFGTATATPASMDSVAPTNAASPNETDSITIVVSIIGAVLALASVVVAILQYRNQKHKRHDVEGGSQVIEMDPQRPAREAEDTPAAPPRSPQQMDPSFVRRGTL